MVKLGMREGGGEGLPARWDWGLGLGPTT